MFKDLCVSIIAYLFSIALLLSVFSYLAAVCLGCSKGKLKKHKQMISKDHVGFYLDRLLPALFKCIFCVCVCVCVCATECICVSVYVNYPAGGG